MLYMYMTCEVSHAEISALNKALPSNSSDMSVTCDTSQVCISPVPAGPQFAVAQHSTPLGSTARQLSTAVLSQYIGSAVAPLSAKGAAIAPGTHARANAAARTVIVDRDFPEGPRHPPRRANRGVMEAGSLSSRRAKMLSNPPPPRSRHKLSAGAGPSRRGFA